MTRRFILNHQRINKYYKGALKEKTIQSNTNNKTNLRGTQVKGTSTKLVM